jgi:hypothetical protein
MLHLRAVGVLALNCSPMRVARLFGARRRALETSRSAGDAQNKGEARAQVAGVFNTSAGIIVLGCLARRNIALA